MKARCVAQEGANLPEMFFEAGFTRRTRFHVTVNHEYPVVSVAVLTGVVCYLIRDDTGFPNWVPAPCFEILDGATGPAWSFTYFHRSKRLPGMMDAMFGHAAIVNDPDLPDALMNRHPAALARFEEIVASELRG